MCLGFLLFLLGVSTAASDASEPAASRPYFTGRLEQDTTWRDTVYVGGDVTIAAADTAELVASLSVEAEPVDSYSLNDRAITRIPKKVGVGLLTTACIGAIPASTQAISQP